MRSFIEETLAALFICALFALSAVALIGWNSDSLATESVFRDLFVNHVPLDGWKLSPAPFIFPDWLLYFFFRALFSNINIVATLVATVFLFGLFQFFRLTERERALKIFCIWLLLYLALFPTEWLSFLLLLAHGGALFVGLFYSRSFIESKSMAPVTFLLLAGVGAATAASDFFFGIQFLIPLGVVSCTQYLRGNIAKREFLLRCALGILVIALTYVFFIQFFSILNIKTDSVGYQIQDGTRTTAILRFTHYLLAYKLKLLAYGFALYLGLKAYRRDPLIQVFLWSCLCSVLCLWACCLWVDSYNVRYLSPIPFTICWLLAKHLCSIQFHTLSHKQKQVAWVVGSALIFFAGQRWVGFIKDSTQIPLNRPYPAIVKCIDETLNAADAHEGYSDYWLSKLTMNLANHSYIVMPVNFGLEYYHWIDNSRWYRSMNNPRFVLRNRATDVPLAQSIQDRWGSPNKTVICDTAEVWLYNEKIPL